MEVAVGPAQRRGDRRSRHRGGGRPRPAIRCGHYWGEPGAALCSSASCSVGSGPTASCGSTRTASKPPPDGHPRVVVGCGASPSRPVRPTHDRGTAPRRRARRALHAAAARARHWSAPRRALRHGRRGARGGRVPRRREQVAVRPRGPFAALSTTTFPAPSVSAWLATSPPRSQTPARPPSTWPSISSAGATFGDRHAVEGLRRAAAAAPRAPAAAAETCWNGRPLSCRRPITSSPRWPSSGPVLASSRARGGRRTGVS